MPETCRQGPRIHTIGHSNHPIERFVALLRIAAVGRLIDVRSHPGSRFHPQFNKTALAKALGAAGIDYCWFGEALGGKPKDVSLFDALGRPDYQRMAATPAFASGIEELIRVARDSSLAIMCAEENPAHCHRTLLVTPELLARGVGVRHIRGDGGIAEHGVVVATRQGDLFGRA